MYWKRILKWWQFMFERHELSLLCPVMWLIFLLRPRTTDRWRGLTLQKLSASANAVNIRGDLLWMPEQVPFPQEAAWKRMPRGSQSLWEGFLVYPAPNVPWKPLRWLNKRHLSVFPWRSSLLAESLPAREIVSVSSTHRGLWTLCWRAWNLYLCLIL